MKELQNEKRKIYEAQDKIANEQADLIKRKDQLSKKIDKKVQRADQIPKALKECQKILETSSGGLEMEQQ